MLERLKYPKLNIFVQNFTKHCLQKKPSCRVLNLNANYKYFIINESANIILRRFIPSLKK